MTELTKTEELNLHLVRKHYTYFSSCDLDGLVAGLAETVEITVSDEQGAENGPAIEGRDGAHQFFETILAAVAHNTVEIMDIRAEGDRVLVSLNLGGTLRETGRTGAIPAVHLFTLREGLITRIRSHRPHWRNLGLPDIDGLG